MWLRILEIVLNILEIYSNSLLLRKEEVIMLFLFFLMIVGKLSGKMVSSPTLFLVFITHNGSNVRAQFLSLMTILKLT